MSSGASGRLLLSAALLAGLAPPAAADPPPTVAGATVAVVAADTGLPAALRKLGRGPEPVWLGYAVPATVAGLRACCPADGNRTVVWGFGRLELDDHSRREGICDLAADAYWVSFTDDPVRADDQSLVVLLRLRGGEVERVRAASPSCTLDTGQEPLHWLTGVTPEESVQMLARLLEERAGDDRLETPALVTISLHRHAAADRELRRVAERSDSTDLVREARFWLGSARGRAGYQVLRSLLDRKERRELRQATVAGIASSPLPEAVEDLIRLARRDKDAEIRREAVFWLAESDDPRALAFIEEILAG